MRKTLLTLLLLLALPSFATSQVFVDDDFEGYTDSNDLYTVWQPRTGNGAEAPANPDDGILWTEAQTFPNPENPNALPFADNLGGDEGVDHIANSVLQYVGPLDPNDPEGAVRPTATKNLVLEADIYDNGVANKRMTVGLRHWADVGGSIVTNDIIEMGFYNAVASGYGNRAILFNTPTDPNWQEFVLPVELDRVDDPETPEDEDDGDEITTIGDIGAIAGEDGAWHRFRATISETDITYEMDLFRDGINNGTNEAGVDSTFVADVVGEAAGYNSLRIGSPSGISSAGGGVVFDNVKLFLEDKVVNPGIPGDYNNNGIVDSADYAEWLRNLGAADETGISENGDGGGVTITDYDYWKARVGNSLGTGTGSGSVPEPAAAVLITSGLIGLLCNFRRREPR